MMLNVYAAYDVFPSSKGSSTHIKEMISELSTHGDELRLLCLRGNDKLPAVQRHENILIKRYYSEEKLNYLEKASLFSEEIFLEIERNEKDIKIAHFRDIWSGMGIIAHKNIKSVFEVNALTSIELPYRYPNLTDDFLSKLRSLEQKCLTNSDVIITPSDTTKKLLVSDYKILENKIKVIPNGAHVPESFERPNDAPNNYIIYFGALQRWQGIEVLLKAMTFLQDYEDLKLVICSSVKEKAFKPLQKLIEKLEISDRVIVKSKLQREELYNYIHFAKLSIAPLKACDRNIIQGCNPLKILESMACETTVVASDLPVVRELVSEKEAMLVEPDRELDLARCIRFLLDTPEERMVLSDRALKKMKKEFTWQIQVKKLNQVYEDLRN
ncbi:glycosyltransferase involved in cell wall biosynthesis [Aquimarina sp. MAR_2010_214]|uniref:glycosyltransferase family 4 protein n=1 Tax=Aquimarina sp. MAR_2010_214 TaxID=1250026 RepID=UPI000C712053|nr:glycosyltransferase family 4 protein [Aquimarina sp. MAR_2010_214]PKV52993.1 glycosyltransferase involved in cell wall biosynthesis [Aquimarina sp. MAR_2010_214]